MPDSVNDVAADVEVARLIRGGHARGRSALEEVTHRHAGAVRTYASLFCGEDQAAEKLVEESFERTLEAVHTDAGPTESWRPHLLAEVRRVAAGWADSGREAALSPGFVAWLNGLPQPDPAVPSARAAVAAAEADSFLLRAFRSLSDRQQVALWGCLEESTGYPSTPRPEPDAPTREILYDAYLQVYASRVPHRPCRHLTAALGDYVRRGVADDTKRLDHHLSWCESCGHARAELVAIDIWQRPVLLRGLLLWTGEPSSSALPVVAASSRPPSTAVPRSSPGTRVRPPHTDGRRPGGGRAPVAFAAVVAALVIAGVALTTVDAAETHPPLVGALPLASSAGSAFPTSSPSASPVDISASPSASEAASPSASEAASPSASEAASPSATPSASPSPRKPTASVTALPSPTPSTPPPTLVVAPPPPEPVGLPLVNRSSGLCVGITDRSAGSPLQLQQCTGQASQRWERIAADRDTYQLRNADTGTCLDGTTSGGNLVMVVLRGCLSGPVRTQQLWRFEPDATSGAVRLWFVPPVPSSDYASHLFGPQNWPNTDPPRVGSSLVHLPDYYHSGSFLFTMG
ncbi:RICIN domain-containing protein [Kitasatospora sp. NPDC127111]|uniref:RICIN domain-containing protein n=1 Tax=Kitasatospora sp. NPDC127111 TaxID=3345363 RepID=UPI0036300868